MFTHWNVSASKWIFTTHHFFTKPEPKLKSGEWPVEVWILEAGAAPLQCEHRHLLHLCLISLPEPLGHPLKIIHASQTHLTNILFKLNECSNDFLRFKKEKTPLFHLEINGLHRPADTDVFKWANIDGWLPVPMQPKRNRWQVRISSFQCQSRFVLFFYHW